jgi:RND family efflux transporter MFP subunit
MPDKNPDGGHHEAAPENTHEKPHGPTPEELRRHHTPAGLKRWAIIAVIVAVVIAVIGIAIRLWHDHTTVQWTDAQIVPVVQVIKLGGGKTAGVLNLPGDVQAFTNAPIYAQVSGYVQKWYFDIGAPVKKGQLLAQIDPRTYQAALDQAKGTLARDSATLTNAKLDLGRYQALAAQNAISSQQLATQQATVNSDAGVAETDRAAVQQAAINLAYTRIIAPFDGIVTSRAVDVGTLVVVGTTSPTPLFTVSDQSRLRVYVQVPQNYGSYIRPGMTVTFTVPQYPGRIFNATLVASSGAVASATGTQLVQFGIDNTDKALQPGAYAEVKFPLPGGANGIRVPATALMFRDAGMQVAVVDATSHVKLKTIIIQRDLGSAVDVGSGIDAKDRIIDNPSDSLQDGDKVQVAGK